IVVIAGPVKVSRHGGNEVSSILPPVGLAKLHTRDLGYCIPLICGLKRTSEQCLLAHRLWCQSRIYTRGAQEQQLFDVRLMCAVNDVGFDRKIVVKELGRPRVISHDGAYRGGGKNDRVWPMVGHPLLYARLLS